jgi:hypothetical protein
MTGHSPLEQGAKGPPGLASRTLQTIFVEMPAALCVLPTVQPTCYTIPGRPAWAWLTYLGTNQAVASGQGASAKEGTLQPDQALAHLPEACELCSGPVSPLIICAMK